jgi:hypothetical protein
MALLIARIVVWKLLPTTPRLLSTTAIHVKTTATPLHSSLECLPLPKRWPTKPLGTLHVKEPPFRSIRGAQSKTEMPLVITNS